MWKTPAENPGAPAESLHCGKLRAATGALLASPVRNPEVDCPKGISPNNLPGGLGGGERPQCSTALYNLTCAGGKPTPSEPFFLK